MRILALIPARGGSKRLPGKNIRQLGGRPLINWSIDVANKIQDICDVLVSTDDTDIASVSKKAGAYVPWLRPAELATDSAGSINVALHALDWYEKTKGSVDGLLLLQPTSPFRTKESIHRGIDLFKANYDRSVIGVSPTNAHPMWAFRVIDNVLSPYSAEHGLGIRSQDLPRAYIVNGSFYLASSASLRANRSFFGTTNSALLIESPKEALDIDTEWDWFVAVAALAYQPDSATEA